MMNGARLIMSGITLALAAVGRGERNATEELFPLVYEELRRMAAARMANEAAGHTLQPTALVMRRGCNWRATESRRGRTAATSSRRRRKRCAAF